MGFLFFWMEAGCQHLLLVRTEWRLGIYWCHSRHSARQALFKQVSSWSGGFHGFLSRGSQWELSSGWELTDATCHYASGTVTCHSGTVHFALPLATLPGTMPLCTVTAPLCYCAPGTATCHSGRQATTIQPSAGFKPPTIHTQEENWWEIHTQHANVSSFILFDVDCSPRLFEVAV